LIAEAGARHVYWHSLVSPSRAAFADDDIPPRPTACDCNSLSRTEMLAFEL
jgi:hypothetical protein